MKRILKILMFSALFSVVAGLLVREFLHNDISFKPFNTEIFSTVNAEQVENNSEIIEDYMQILPWKFIDYTNYKDVRKVSEGEEFAEVFIPTLDIKTKAYYGIDQVNVDSNDLCVSAYSGIVKSVILCGHNTNSLSNLKFIENGDYIFLKTDYGTFVYCVEYATKGVLTPDQKNITVFGENFIDKKVEDDTLYIFTCAEEENERYVALAKLIKGTEISDKPEE